MTTERARVECEHLEDDPGTGDFMFNLDGNMRGPMRTLWLCDGCYARLKAAVIQDIIDTATREIARELSRAHFLKR